MAGSKRGQGLFFRLKRTRGVDYLQLVANDRRGAQVRQRVLASLGRLDEIRTDGSLDRLVGAGAALSNRALFLAPPAYDAVPELVRDESLAMAIMEMLGRTGPAAEILSAFCAADPANLRRLVTSVTFGGLDAVAHMPRGLQIVHALGMHGNRDKDEVVSFATLARASAAPAKRGGLIVTIRPAAASGFPSMTRGLMTFLVHTEDGEPLAAGHWPAHLSPLKMASDLAAQVKERLGAPLPVIMFDRSFSSDAFFSALGKLTLDFIVPLREANPGALARGAWEGWTCNETRPPRRDSADSPDTPANMPGLRFIQIVDGPAAERDWRLRNAQMERLRRTVVAMGTASPNANRLHSAHHSLQEAQRWDGVTLFATNLKQSPDEAARLYAAATAIRAWEHELTEFGRSLLDMGTSPRDTEALLAGGAAVALVAAFMRHTLANLLSERLQRHCGWDEIDAALSGHQAVRLSQGNRDVTVAFDATPALAALLEALGMPREARARRQAGIRPLRRRRMQNSG